MRRAAIRLPPDRAGDRPAEAAGLADPSPGSIAAGPTSPAIATLTVGAIALGAFALGAIAMGSVAIGYLTIGRGRIRSLRIDRLSIGAVERDGGGENQPARAGE